MNHTIANDLQLSYFHPFTLAAGKEFIQTLIEEHDHPDITQDVLTQWLDQAELANGKGVLEFLADQTNTKPVEYLAKGSRFSKVPIIDCEHINLSPRPHFTTEGLPLTLLTSSDTGSITLIHCVPFLEKHVDLEFLSNRYNAIRINFTLTTPDDYVRHLIKAKQNHKLVHIDFSKTSVYGETNFETHIESLKELQLLPPEFPSSANRAEILTALEKQTPKPNTLGETHWHSLLNPIPFVSLHPLPTARNILAMLDTATQQDFNIAPIYATGRDITIVSNKKLTTSQLATIKQRTNPRHCRLYPILAHPEPISDQIKINATTTLSVSITDPTQYRLNDPETNRNQAITVASIQSSEANFKAIGHDILLKAAMMGASDIHIHPDGKNTRVRFRIDGRMQDYDTLPLNHWKPLISSIKVAFQINVANVAVPQDGFQTLPIGSDTDLYDIRANQCKTIHGEKIVLRLQKRSEEIPTLDQLGYHEHEKNIIQDCISADHGLLIICGPTGSGKTTTLAATIYAIDRQEYVVVTGENPVEIQIPDTLQTAVETDVDPGLDSITQVLTYPRFIRSALRSDPDYIMVGETRDIESAQGVIQAARTGHVVFTTLHTNTAAGVPARLRNLGIPPYEVADVLTGVCAQRLVRKLCVHCKQNDKNPPNPEVLKANNIPESWLKDIFPRWKEPGIDPSTGRVGCKVCNYTGYKGRTSIAEGYKTSAKLRNIIIEHNCNRDMIIEEIHRQGGKTLFNRAIELAANGITSFKEALETQTTEA
jgi:type IV pilus assembly protein PilB